MALSEVDLLDVLEDELVMIGVSKALAERRAKRILRLGAKLFWRTWPWTFSMKRGSLTLSEDETYLSAPDDCEMILGIQRQTSSDYGYDLVEYPVNQFDKFFPYPDAHSADQVMSYKVESDDGSKKIYTFPVSDDDDSSSILYKQQFDSVGAFLALLPEDYEPHLITAAMAFGHPSGNESRAYAWNEWRRMRIEAIKNDHVSFRLLVQHTAGLRDYNFHSLGSWQLAVAGGRQPYEV